MINKEQLRKLIKEVLTEIDLYSESAEELLMLTAAVESELGFYIEQIGTTKGGKGVWQMEMATCKDIYNNYLKFKDDHFLRRVGVYDGTGDLETNLKGNIPFQITRVRLHYLRKSEPLPHHTDIKGLARYWKSHYNSYKGKGTVEKAIEAYNVYVA